MSIEFLLTALIVVLAPGTGVLYTLATALARGFRPGVIAAFGCTLGIVPHLVASILGLAALLHTSAVAFQVVKYAGVAYLLWLAWQTLREGGTLSPDGPHATGGAYQIIIRAILINILNPKLSMFFLAFLPQFVAADAAAPTATMSGLAAVFMAMTFVVFVGYGLFAAAARRHVIDRPVVMKWLRGTVAGAFALLGLRLAFAESS